MRDHAFRRILASLDGSEHSHAAMRLAVMLARQSAAELVCCNVVDMRFMMMSQTYATGYVYDPTPMIDAMRSEGEAIVSAAVALAHAGGINAIPCVILETPVAGIISSALTNSCDLIVMGTRGRSDFESEFLGSTTHGVLRECAIPVMTVRAKRANAPDEPVAFTRALVAVDDSDPSDAAVRFALAFADDENVRLVFCTVADIRGNDSTAVRRAIRGDAYDLVDSKRDRAEALGITADTSVVDGDTVPAILHAASFVGADLIVIGSHGRRGLRRLFLGSVAELVVRRSTSPVLVVRTVRHVADAIALPQVADVVSR